VGVGGGDHLGHGGEQRASGEVGLRVRRAREEPSGKIDYSSGGNGSPQHVAMEAFKAATGIDVVHSPYRGATQAAVDVMSNRAQVHLGAVSIMLPYIKDGRMRALGVPSAARSPLLPKCRPWPRRECRGSSGAPGRRSYCRSPRPTNRRSAEHRDGESGELARRAREADRPRLEPIGSKPEMVTQWTRTA